MPSAVVNKKEIFFNRTLSWLLYLFVFLLPWQTRWIFQDARVGNDFFEYGRMSLYAFDIVLIVMIVIFFLACSLGTRFNVGFSKAEAVGVVLLLMILLVMVYSASFWAVDQLISFYWLARFILAFIFLIVVWKINFSFIKLIAILSFGACCQVVLGFWQVSVGRIFAAKWLGMASHEVAGLKGESVVEFSGERLLRAYGSLPHPNILAGLLVVSFALLIYLVLKVESKYQRLFLFICFTIETIGIFLTFSRSAWLAALFLVIFLFSVFSRKSTYDVRRLCRALAVWAVLIIAILSFVFWQPMNVRLFGAGRLEKISIEKRLNSWQEAVYFAQNNWPAGVGIGNYTHELKRLAGNNFLPLWSYEPVHNVYLLVWAELDIAGFSALFFLLMYFIARLLATRDLQFTGWPLPVLITGGALGVVFFLMFFDHYFWTTAFGINLWFLTMALFLKTIGQHEQDKILPVIASETFLGQQTKTPIYPDTIDPVLMLKNKLFSIRITAANLIDLLKNDDLTNSLIPELSAIIDIIDKAEECFKNSSDDITVDIKNSATRALAILEKIQNPPDILLSLRKALEELK